MAREELQIRNEGKEVLLIQGGRLLVRMPYDAALQLADAIKVKAHLAGEYANAGQIITDGSILHRAGMPFGLTNNPALKKEIAKESRFNRILRRFMPGGVKSTGGVMGTPTVIKH